MIQKWKSKQPCILMHNYMCYSEVVTVKEKDINHQDDSSSEEETAQEKRIRLAKEYIAELEEQGVHMGCVYNEI